jgi:hypothetical protein
MKKHLLSTAATLIFITTFVIVIGCGGKEATPPPVEVMPDTDVKVKPPPDTPPKAKPDVPVKVKPGSDAKVKPNLAVAVPAVKFAPDSVLNVVPKDATGVIYVQNLLGFNDEVNTLLADLIPEDPPQELLASALAGAFGAGFESLAELEELGFDFSRDFALFLTQVTPPVPSAVVHIKNPETVKQLIESEAEGSQAVPYNGMTYHTTGESGGFVLLDDIMVYSGSEAVCEQAIDTFKKMGDSIAANTDYAALQLDTTSGANDLLFYFQMEKVVDAVRPLMTASAEGMKSRMEEEAETNPQLMSGLAMSHKLIDKAIWLLDQAKTLSMTLQLNGSDLAIAPFLKFKGDSEIQDYIEATSKELTPPTYLPQTAFFNGMMRLEKESVINLTRGMMTLFIPSDPNADSGKIEEATEQFNDALTDFYEPLGSETGFSINFSDSLMPDVLYVYDVTDEKKIKEYMKKDFLTYLQTSQTLIEAIGTEGYPGMYDGASIGPAEEYNGTEIGSYSLPNISNLFAQLPAEMGGVAPNQWNIYYTVTDGKLLYAMSGSPQPIKDTLERLGGGGISFDQGAGYNKLNQALTLKNSMFFALSPITAVKSLVEVFAQADPNVGMIQMLLINIPETYSIGISSQNRDGGVEGKLFVSIADFKEVITMGAMMRGMQQQQ